MDERKLKGVFKTLYHDVNGSIGVSASLLNLLDKEYSCALDDKARNWLSLVVMECSSAQHKLHAFRDYAQLFDCEYEFTACDINEIFMKCAMKEEAAKRTGSGELNLEIEYDVFPIIHSSSELILMFYQEVFSNIKQHAQLASNTPSNIGLKCQVRYQATATHHVLVCEDNGCSITTEKLNTIQRPFQSSLACSHDHCGMGFSKLHRISELLGGHMNVSLGEAPYTGLRISLFLERK
ncbi:ATP-binding protein [Glaciecola sp. 2405UD65-10]|uniref:ATP-binding protein n=1 Tax=Glaciecola sp. 2405UD65-10 TaxID=3397244 RepID=UPI003B5C8E4E